VARPAAAVDHARRGPDRSRAVRRHAGHRAADQHPRAPGRGAPALLRRLHPRPAAPGGHGGGVPRGRGRATLPVPGRAGPGADAGPRATPATDVAGRAGCRPAAHAHRPRSRPGPAGRCGAPARPARGPAGAVPSGGGPGRPRVVVGDAGGVARPAAASGSRRPGADLGEHARVGDPVPDAVVPDPGGRGSRRCAPGGQPRSAGARARGAGRCGGADPRTGGRRRPDGRGREGLGPVALPDALVARPRARPGPGTAQS
jgi:hypothetical protein